ncbi:hypothetical protein LTR36_000624 [Oleoguttula mirabilis]|uniref:BZIP domain-containing protein n=1 Tax=Oleoguttula mirabilis TaxID=1507867 RepID=A0AAV9JQH4_9PEZI|nr:hypothetical protein LTR36_000624 [Oleoguttula mirabilis]
MSSDAQQFLKLEDLHSAASPSPSFDTSLSSQTPAMLQTSPPPVIVQSKQAKKRKSWGQELPEPTTALPPRKRAKTDDEKEQRRIERIKRNRAAAHNSRERKRQETETLAVALARANAELQAYRNIHGPLPASVVLPEVQVIHDYDGTPAPSLIESHGSAEAAPTPASPDDDDDDNFQLIDHVKQEPLDNTYRTISFPTYENLDAKPSPLSPLDQTQHSAAMLWDLQYDDEPSFNAINFSQLLGLGMGDSFSAPHDVAAPEQLQDPFAGDLEPLAFANGAYDASFSPSLNFTFDDFIHDPTVAVDGFGAA